MPFYALVRMKLTYALHPQLFVNLLLVIQTESLHQVAVLSLT